MKLSRPSFNPGRMKNVVHGVQAVLIFLAWALTIAVWTKGDGIDGRTAWYWALVSFLPLILVHANQVLMRSMVWIVLVQYSRFDLSRGRSHVAPSPTIRQRLCLREY